MRKKLIILLLIMLLIVLAGVFTIKLSNSKKEDNAGKDDDSIRVVTTIYPIYLIGLNLFDQMEGVEVISMINRNTGCLHDYQLTTQDMKLIATADVLIINGGGMESFLEDIAANYPALTVIDASEGIEMLPEYELHTEEQEEENFHSTVTDEEEEYNSHVWLDPRLYEQQIDNVRNGLISYLNSDKKYEAGRFRAMEERMNQNADNYFERIQEVEREVELCKNEIKQGTQTDQIRAVIFHDAFAYLADRLDIKVSFSVELEADTSLSAGNFADIIREIREKQIAYIFTEEQYSDMLPKQVAAETDRKVYVIDSVVTGEERKDSYLTAMRNNLKVIREAVK